MKVIVIIVTYNGMRWYKSCFDSLRSSSIPLETIVIDNKSTDNTVNYIKENYPEIHLIESGINLGFGKANNIGFEYAIEQDADFVFLLNQDAWIKPDTIEKMVLKMKEYPEYGILSPMHLNGSETELDFGFRYYISPDMCPNLISDFIVKGKPEDKVYTTKFVNAALWLISKKCFNEIGGFLPLFPHYGEDGNYTSRLEYHNYKIGVYPYSWAVHDRSLGERKIKTFSKLKNEDLVNSLIELTNINQPLLTCICRNYFYILLTMLRNLFSLSFKKVLINIITSAKIIYLLPRIIKERNISKSLGRSFLFSEKS